MLDTLKLYKFVTLTSPSIFLVAIPIVGDETYKKNLEIIRFLAEISRWPFPSLCIPDPQTLDQENSESQRSDSRNDGSLNAQKTTAVDL